MRTAVCDAKQAIQAAKALGLVTRESERLLAEAIATSYRLDYNHARSLAKKAEAVALEQVERETRVANGNGHERCEEGTAESV
jgi:hypothetical protein